MNDKKIIVALDGNNFHDLKNIVDEIKSHVFAFKIGYEFFLNFGLDGYKFIQNKNDNIDKSKVLIVHFDQMMNDFEI